jgi:hypothetical protein
MHSQLFFKFSINKFLFYLSLFILSHEQQCILGKNCPVNQGLCVTDICVCSEGYQTMLDKSIPIDQQIFCNYKKISQYTPIVTEIFLPSLGHFIVGNYWLGLIKIALLLAYVISSYSLYKKVTIPILLKILLNKIGLSVFLGVPLLRSRQRDNKIIILKKIFHISGTLFSLMYFVDLFFYKFGIYTDGNGVPFI